MTSFKWLVKTDWIWHDSSTKSKDRAKLTSTQAAGRICRASGFIPLPKITCSGILPAMQPRNLYHLHVLCIWMYGKHSWISQTFLLKISFTKSGMWLIYEATTAGWHAINLHKLTLLIEFLHVCIKSKLTRLHKTSNIKACINHCFLKFDGF